MKIDIEMVELYLLASLKFVKSWFRAESISFEERRAVKRERVSFMAEIDGPEGLTSVRGIDIHSEGTLVLSRKLIPVGTAVYVQLKSFDLGGLAEVRHCTSRKGQYALGLQFRGHVVRQAGTWQTKRVYNDGAAWTAFDDFQTPEDEVGCRA